MKLALCLLLLGNGDAFVSQPQLAPKTATALRAHKNEWFAPAAVAVAGWAMAAQLSFASPAEPTTILPDTRANQEILSSSASYDSSVMLSAFGGQSFETLDFSLPSYSDAVGGAKDAIKEAPKFANPFGSLMGGEEPAVEDTAKADTKAAAEAARAEKESEKEAARAAKEAEREAARSEKEAAASRKAEEKAAAEAKKAEEKAAVEQEKADKEARRKEQLEKQREAVERAKKRDEVVETKQEEQKSAFEMPSVSMPEMPSVSMPDIKLPSMSLPSVQMPETPDIKLPTITKPDLKLPAMPKLDFNLPSTPDVKFEIPKFESMPKLPSLQAPGMPKLPQTADMPSFEAPKDMPKLSLPSISVPSFGGGKEPEADLGLEPQEVRDERARDARNIFLDYDKVAKDMERQAREARDQANDKKKIAQGFKDEACKTRWGGKILCLRPFGVGY